MFIEAERQNTGDRRQNKSGRRLFWVVACLLHSVSIGGRACAFLEAVSRGEIIKAVKKKEQASPRKLACSLSQLVSPVKGGSSERQNIYLLCAISNLFFTGSHLSFWPVHALTEP
jgi:hypothetical protein